MKSLKIIATKVGDKNITLSKAKESLEDLIGKSISRKRAKNIYNDIVEDVQELIKVKITGPRKILLNILSL